MEKDETLFVPTREQRMTVCKAIYADWDRKMIARDLNISTQCLQKHFRDELRNGRSLLAKYAKMAYVEAAFGKQSVASLRKISEELDAPAAKTDEAQATAEKKPEAVGKKEQRARDAHAAVGNGIFQPAKPPAHMKPVNGAH